MLSGGAVSVPGLDNKPGAEQRTFGIDGEIGRPAQQVARQQKLHTFMRQPFVRRQILARSVGVDRHLSRLASADRRYEIQGDHAALLASQLKSGIRDTYFHDPNSRCFNISTRSNVYVVFFEHDQ